MEDSRTERSLRYLASLKDRDGVRDEFYLALLDYADTPQAKATSTLLAFHRGIGTGGLDRSSPDCVRARSSFCLYDQSRRPDWQREGVSSQGDIGLAQALSNERGDVASVLDALEQLGPRAESAKALVVEAAELHRSLPEEPDQAGDAWDRYQVAYEMAKEQWDALDKRYFAATNPVVPGDDRLEKAVLAFALAHPAAFSTAVEKANPNGMP